MKTLISILTTFAFVLILTGPAVAMHHAVKVAQKEAIGSYLTDTEGMTLYWFTKDSVGQSACAGDCVTKWPLFYRDSIKAPEGVSAADFGTITRADGAEQTTFRGYPLYYFFKDKAAGDTLGEGVKEVWYVIDPNNFPK